MFCKRLFSCQFFLFFIFLFTAYCHAADTLAIFPLENYSIGASGEYANMGKTISAILTTEMSNNKNSFEIIDRERIKTVVDELEFSQTAFVDQETALKIGRILGAKYIVFGSFMIFEDVLRIDVRIIQTETSRVLLAEYSSGNKKELVALVSELAGKISGRSAERLSLNN